MFFKKKQPKEQTVYVVLHGEEEYAGGRIEGVYSTLEEATDKALKTKPAYGSGRWNINDFGSNNCWTTGLEFIRIEKHTVTGENNGHGC